MKILILCLPAIGDGLMATPMIRVLRKKYPDARIDVACMMSGVSYIFKNNTFVDNVYYLKIYSQNILRGGYQLWQLRKTHYDVSILSFPSYRREYHFVQSVIAAKKRIAHSFSTGYWLEFNFLNTDLIAVDETSHNVVNNLNLTYALNIDWNELMPEENIKYDLSLDKADKKFGKAYLKSNFKSQNNFVAIHPGSTNSPAALLRRWPTDRYAQIINRLTQLKYNVLIFLGPEEESEAMKLRVLLTGTRHRFVEHTSFNQSLGILSHMKLLICNDNGFGHLANALGIPIVTLWASTNDKLSLPFNKKLVNLIRAKKFVPWYRYILKREVPQGVSGGMEMIQVPEVMAAVRKSLASIRPS